MVQHREWEVDLWNLLLDVENENSEGKSELSKSNEGKHSSMSNKNPKSDRDWSELLLKKGYNVFLRTNVYDMTFPVDHDVSVMPIFDL